MKMSEDEDQVQTLMGSLCSLLMLLVVGSYAYLKVGVWQNNQDITILRSKQDSYFTPDFIFDQEMGLNFAVAFTAYDNVQENILDEEYARIVFNSYQWGPDEEGNFKTEIKEIPSHTCTKEELGIEGDASNFMPISPANLAEVTKYQKKFRCIDKD